MDGITNIYGPEPLITLEVEVTTKSDTSELRHRLPIVSYLIRPPLTHTKKAKVQFPVGKGGDSYRQVYKLIDKCSGKKAEPEKTAEETTDEPKPDQLTLKEYLLGVGVASAVGTTILCGFASLIHYL